MKEEETIKEIESLLNFLSLSLALELDFDPIPARHRRWLRLKAIIRGREREISSLLIDEPEQDGNASNVVFGETGKIKCHQRSRVIWERKIRTRIPKQHQGKEEDWWRLTPWHCHYLVRKPECSRWNFQVSSLTSSSSSPWKCAELLIRQMIIIDYPLIHTTDRWSPRWNATIVSSFLLRILQCEMHWLDRKFLAFLRLSFLLKQKRRRKRVKVIASDRRNTDFLVVAFNLR